MQQTDCCVVVHWLIALSVVPITFRQLHRLQSQAQAMLTARA